MPSLVNLSEQSYSHRNARSLWQKMSPMVESPFIRTQKDQSSTNRDCNIKHVSSTVLCRPKCVSLTAKCVRSSATEVSAHFSFPWQSALSEQASNAGLTRPTQTSSPASAFV